MADRHDIPWVGILLAAGTMLGLIILGVEPVLALPALLIWGGTLALAAGRPPVRPPPPEPTPFTRDAVRELIEHSGTPILLTERNRITMASRSARQVLGGHIVGQDVRVALRHPEAIALHDRGGTGSTVIHGLARRKDIWRVSRQAMGGGYAIIELINRTAEADLSRAHTDFVANASHELRTPLASIIGYVETLKESDGTLDSARATKFLDTILREARRLQSLVSDLMSLSRIEAEKHDQPDEVLSLGALVERAARDAAGTAGAERLRLDCQGEAMVRGDQQQLEQLVRNLVDNGLKYSEQDRPLTVRLDMADNGEARLCVIDQGDGIAPEHLPHLTRRFYRTDPGRSRASGGTGLGLAIVKHIVERHRGRLDIRSAVGQGTEVAIRIPTVNAVSGDDIG